MSSKQHGEALCLLGQMELEIANMRNAITTQVTPQQRDVIAALQLTVFRASEWVCGKSIHQPQTRVELPQETVARHWRERNNAGIAPRKAPDTIRGVAFS